MENQLALKIKNLRTGELIHSLRRIAEIICEEHPELVVNLGYTSPKEVSGNQLLGQDIIYWACGVLNESPVDWEDELERRLDER